MLILCQESESFDVNEEAGFIHASDERNDQTQDDSTTQTHEEMSIEAFDMNKLEDSRITEEKGQETANLDDTLTTVTMTDSIAFGISPERVIHSFEVTIKDMESRSNDVDVDIHENIAFNALNDDDEDESSIINTFSNDNDES